MTEPPQHPPAENPSAGEPPAGRPRPTPGQQYGPTAGQQYGPAAGQQYGPAAGQQYGPAAGQQYGPAAGQYDAPGGQPGSEPQYVPQYPPPGYGEQYPPDYGGAPGGSSRAALADRLGPRVLRRSEPRFGVTLAGVGVALAVFGIVVLGSTGGDGGSTISGGGHKAIGIVLSLALVAAGYGIAWIRRTGPLSTAGIGASALGVPVLLAYVCDAADTGTTATTNIVLLGSLVVWLASYLVVPGAQGHLFYLGASTITLWFLVLNQVQSNFLAALVLAPFASLRLSFGVDDDFSFTGLPDFTTIATVSILFGVAYYLVAYLLDRTGRSGAATAFVVGGLPAMVLGLAVAAVNAAQSLEGVLIILVGAALGLAGARTGRRFTTWFWCLGVGLGIVVILADVVGDHESAAGVSLIALGVLVVLAGQLVTSALREPDETTPLSTPTQAGPPVA